MRRRRGTVKLANGEYGILEACDQDTCEYCIEWCKKGQYMEKFHFLPITLLYV